MNKWIQLNLPVNRVCKKALNKIIKESKIKKPNIKKHMGFDPEQTLIFFKLSRYVLNYFDEGAKYILDETSRTFGIPEIISRFKNINDKFAFSKNLYCINTFNSSILSEEELTKTFDKFQIELNNLQKILNYLDKNNYKELKQEIINYCDTINNFKRECKFYTCKYNKPGYLVNLINPKTNKVYSYLIGTDSTIDKYFEKETKELIAVRVKKVVSDEELAGVHIFE